MLEAGETPLTTEDEQTPRRGVRRELSGMPPDRAALNATETIATWGPPCDLAPGACLDYRPMPGITREATRVPRTTVPGGTRNEKLRGFTLDP